MRYILRIILPECEYLDIYNLYNEQLFTPSYATNCQGSFISEKSYYCLVRMGKKNWKLQKLDTWIAYRIEKDVRKGEKDV